jgi:hypothetical protein
MKKTSKIRLTLHRETLRNLASPALTHVRGGQQVEITGTASLTCPVSCQTTCHVPCTLTGTP